MSTNNFVPYDGKESFIDYKERLYNFHRKLTESDYIIIFNFIKDWLSQYAIPIKSLLDFKNISEKKIISNKTHNKKIYKKYQKELSSKYDLKKNLEDVDEIDTDELLEDDVIKLVRLVLPIINYKLVKYNTDSIVYYSIKSE